MLLNLWGLIIKKLGCIYKPYKKIQEILVSTRQGRSKESGTKLTPRALELMENYSILQKDIEEYANKRFKELFLKGKK